MNPHCLSAARMSALAFLYDRMRDFPEWFRKLTPRQVEDIVDVMVQWQLPNDSNSIVPLEEVERREVLRAVVTYHGDALEAARALKIGKTTMYRKLKQWGYILERQLLLAQASVLRGSGKRPRRQLGMTAGVSSDQRISDPVRQIPC